MAELSFSMVNFYTLMDTLINNSHPCKIKTRCKGSSMVPAICNDDLVIIKPINLKKKLQVGCISVVAFPNNKKILIHRIIKIKPDYYLTKGDNLFEPDNWVKKDQIIGVVEKVIKKRISYHNIAVIDYVMAKLSMIGFFIYFNRFLFFVAQHLRKNIGSI